jgi:hypothetical protein
VTRRLRERRAGMTRRAILLQSELRVAGESLFHVGDLLRKLSSGIGKRETYIVTLNAAVNAPEVCGLSRIAVALIELQETLEWLDALDRSAVP